MRRIGSMTWHRHMFRGSRTLRGGRKYGRRSCMAWSARGVPPGWAIMARGHRGRDGPFPLLPRYPVHGRRGLCLGQDDAHGGFSAIRQCLAARLAERAGRSEYVIIGRSPGGASLRARISPCRRASAGGCSIRPRCPAAASLPACFARAGIVPGATFCRSSGFSACLPAIAASCQLRTCAWRRREALIGVSIAGWFAGLTLAHATPGAPGVPATAIIGERLFLLGLAFAPGDAGGGVVTWAETCAEWLDEESPVRQSHLSPLSSLAVARISPKIAAEEEIGRNSPRAEEMGRRKGRATAKDAMHAAGMRRDEGDMQTGRAEKRTL